MQPLPLPHLGGQGSLSQKNLFVDFDADTLSRAAYIPQEPPNLFLEYSEQKRLVAIGFKNWPFYKEKLAIISQKILKWP